MELQERPVSIFWFRRDLRLQDNHGLYKALTAGNVVLPIFIFDTDILDKLPDKNDRRVNFIYNTIEKLKCQVENIGSSLYVLNTTPLSGFKQVCDQFKVIEVFANHDYEPYAIDRDVKIRDFLSGRGIGFRTYKDQVIFERSEVVKSDGKPYTIYTPYANVWKQKYAAGQPVQFKSEDHTNNFLQVQPLTIPSLSSLGFQENNISIDEINITRATIEQYNNLRNFPATAGTSYVGIHLRFGTISIRQLVKLAYEYSMQWLNELIWREFFMMILFHFPHVVHQSFKIKYENIQWRNNENEFELWCRGETGYPIVDAGMRQLNQTGWMHNRVRLIVASFLTKHLLIDWRWGEAYFAQKLLDYELASNNGNWQWAAGSGCDAAPYFRIFNPYEQTKKFDPELVYIKRWIKGFQPGYLPPVVDHAVARNRAIETYKRSLS